MNSVAYIPRREASRYISSAEGVVVLVFTKSVG